MKKVILLLALAATIFSCTKKETPDAVTIQSFTGSFSDNSGKLKILKGDTLITFNMNEFYLVEYTDVNSGLTHIIALSNE
jgi:hypothetical protein